LVKSGVFPELFSTPLLMACLLSHLMAPTLFPLLPFALRFSPSVSQRLVPLELAATVVEGDCCKVGWAGVEEDDAS